MGVPQWEYSSSPSSPRKAPILMWPHALRRDPALAARPDLVEAMEVFQLISDHSAAWDPEPPVVMWARSICEDKPYLTTYSSSQGGSNGHPPRPTRHAAPQTTVAGWAGAGAALDALLVAGADVNAPGFGGETALHVVADKMRTSTFHGEGYRLASRAWHHLVSRGAESSVVDVDGATPLERLTRAQCRDLLSTRRSTYSAQRYERARMQGPGGAHVLSGEDASSSASAFTSTTSLGPPSVMALMGPHGVYEHSCETPQPQRGSKKGSVRNDSPTPSTTGASWVHSLRTPRSARLDLPPRSPRIGPRVLRMSLDSVSPPSSPGSRKERVYFTPPTRLLPK